MDWIFENCDKLTSLDLSIFNTENVDNFNNIFYNCKQLVSVNLSNWNTTKGKYYIAMFTFCESLTSIVFPALILKMQNICYICLVNVVY